MLTLQEMFEDLALGPLRSLSVYDATTETIKVTSWPSVVSYINRALTDIHKRFPLSMKQLIVQQHPYLATYALRSAFAESNTASLEPVKYIKDSPLFPFQDDIIKIEQVFSELGAEYPINDSTQPYPVYTPEYDVLHMVPTGDFDNAQAVFVLYRAKHPKIRITSGSIPSSINIKVPDSMLDALYSRIGSYAHKSVSGEEGEASASRSFMFQYELECKRLEIENVVSNDNEPSTTFGDRGWL